jgi:general stress protein 26
MADLNAARTDAEHQLWEEIDGVHAGMLGIEGSDASQPMAPEVDREAKTIWFFTHKSTDLAKAAAKPGARGTFTVVGKHHDYHASLSGTLEEHVDPAVRDRFWNSIIEAWFDRGKKDPDLTMLALKLDHGHIWASTDSSLKYSWQMAKANMTGAEPDVGVSRQLNF